MNRELPESVTLDMVAELAGVSKSTVSRVVNGSNDVSARTRDSVGQAIASLNYVPNRAARSLASRQTHAIALIVAEDSTRFFSDPFFPTIVSGINAYLNDTDYVLNLFVASGDPGDKTTRYVRSGAVDGALIVSHHSSDQFLNRVAASVPVVYGGRPMTGLANDFYVDVDNARGGREATEYLLRQGHRRIAMIAGRLTMSVGIDRLDGFRAALAAAGLSEAAVEQGDFTLEGGAAAMRRILDRGEAPDAVFAASDLMARGAIRVLRSRRLRVPHDVAVIGFDDSPVATSASPHLTTMRQPWLLQGAKMASVLVDLLAGRQPPRVTLLDPELVVRRSA